MSWVATARGSLNTAGTFVVVAALVGYACAPVVDKRAERIGRNGYLPDTKLPDTKLPDTKLPDQQVDQTLFATAPATKEEVAAILARASCPGWMAMVGDDRVLSGSVTPASLAASPDAVYGAAVRKTSNRVVYAPPPVSPPLFSPPGGQYADPLCVASRQIVSESKPVGPVRSGPVPSGPAPSGPVPSGQATGSAGGAHTSGNRALIDEPLLNDKDDLLDGVEDLLIDSPQTPARPRAAASKGTVTFDEDDLLGDRDDLLEEDIRATLPVEALPAPVPEVTEPSTIQPTTPFVPPPLPRGSVAPAPGRAPPSSVPHSVDRPAASAAPHQSQVGAEPHCELLAKSMYPSAKDCRQCHEKIYDEWSVSAHAYAMVSPMFHRFEQKINDLTQGTIGYFCYRCHSPAGVSLGISRTTPLWNLPQVAREGISCVSCHRVRERYGKVNGQRRIEPGDQFAPIYGPFDGDGVAAVLAQKNKYKVKTSPHEKGPGQNIHLEGRCFEQLNRSEYCVSCHQVAVQPGIKLEVVWEQYRASPACKKGIQCQDCHMGRIPGVPSGYEYTAIAKVNEKTVHTRRKHGNHIFYGPGYSIAHPGVFPFNPDADRWSFNQWLQFEYRAGWGTKEFEDQVAKGAMQISFPKVWAEVDDRIDAREIIEDNQKKLAGKTRIRRQVMENGSHVDGPFFDSPQRRGEDLRFHYIVINTNEGHNLPSGSLGAQPQLWANVVLIGPRGGRLWESGYTDRFGDVADIHSHDVRNKLVPFDWQLFNLQTMFLITGAKGTDREFYLPINLDIDQLPFIRPGAQPISVINHPPFIRMQGQSIAATGSRRAPYRVPKHLLFEPGRYRLSFRMRSRMEPIYFMRFVGATPDMQRAMNEGILNFHESSVEFYVR